MIKQTKITLLIAFLIITTFLAYFIIQYKNTPNSIQSFFFDGEQALEYIQQQLAFGPRTVGSDAHTQVVEWMQEHLREAGWQVELQITSQMGHPITNVIAKRGFGSPWVVIGAHYDSRLISDQEEEPSQQNIPVPGANDSASGVAVLMELAHALPEDYTSQIWLVFFDAEDNGRIEGWDWILGSRAFVDSLDEYPDAVIVIDMIGDTDLRIYLEQNSDLNLAAKIWGRAATLGYGTSFIPIPKYRMIDDHTPFIQVGIPTVLIIDFDYPYWHTTEDTLDKVSAVSLQVVGDTLLQWLLSQPSP
jgi:glutaminyl-peptide cyclotransferase